MSALWTPQFQAPEQLVDLLTLGVLFCVVGMSALKFYVWRDVCKVTD